MADPFVGEIRAFAFNYQTPGWVACNGQTLQISQYQALYALLGNIFGGQAPNTFAVPNLCGRMIVGANNPAYPVNGQPTPVAFGTAAGVNSVTLTVEQLPSHTHAVTVTDPGHTHTVSPAPHTHSFAVPCDDGTNGPNTNSPVNAYPTLGSSVDSNFAAVVGDVNDAVNQITSSPGTYTNPPTTLLFSKNGSQAMAPGTTGPASASGPSASGASPTGVHVVNASTGSYTPVPIAPPTLGIGYWIATTGIFPVRC